MQLRKGCYFSTGKYIYIYNIHAKVKLSMYVIYHKKRHSNCKDFLIINHAWVLIDSLCAKTRCSLVIDARVIQLLHQLQQNIEFSCNKHNINFSSNIILFSSNTITSNTITSSMILS